MGHEQDQPGESEACAVAHGHGGRGATEKTLIAAFASSVAEFLLHFAGDAGTAWCCWNPIRTSRRAPGPPATR